MASDFEHPAPRRERSLPFPWMVIGLGVAVHVLGFFYFFPYAAEVAADRCAKAQNLGYRVGMEDWESDWLWCQMSWLDLFCSLLALCIATPVGAALTAATKVRGFTRYSTAITLATIPFLIGYFAFSQYPTS